MLTYPNIDPVAFSVGPLHVHWYGLMYLLAFGTAWLLATYRIKKAGSTWNAEQVSDLLFFCAMGIILGGRVGYVLFYNFGQFLKDPVWLFRVWEGGMSFHGGLLGVLIAVAWFSHKYKKSFFDVGDFVAPFVPIGLMFGRIGNFIGGELWGRIADPASVPWAMVFPTDPLQLVRHPSQLYQALCEGLILFIVLWWFSSKPRPRMAVSALFLIGYGVARFIVEFFREPDNGQLFIGWMSKGQFLSLPMILIGLWMMWYAYQKKIYDWGPQKNV